MKKNNQIEVSHYKKRKIKTEEVFIDDGDGNWLVSYADMMTLLFGFFLMISVFSVPNSKMLEEFKQKTSESMGGKYVRPFKELSSGLKQIMKDIDVEKEVSVEETYEGVTVVSKGTLFFDSGSATLKPEAALLMEKLSQVLVTEAKDFRIIVEGHTDDNPIYSKEFASNWELSSTRAGQIIRLLEARGFPRINLRPVGLADTEPVLPNRDASGHPIPENQAENRRIVVRIQKQLLR
jgi:chemotaxis protein MotB